LPSLTQFRGDRVRSWLVSFRCSSCCWVIPMPAS
jgi:hypothetical protein